MIIGGETETAGVKHCFVVMVDVHILVVLVTPIRT